MYNIAINVGGFHQIGTGHAYRQITITEEMPEFKYYFFINENQNLAKKLLDENLVEYHTFTSYRNFIDIVKDLDIKIVINDFLNTEKSYIKNLKKMGYFVVNFEDKGEGARYADVVINDMYSCNTSYFNTYNGYSYTCMRRDLKLYPSLSFKIKPKTMILSFGGSDPQNYTKQVLDVLVDNNIHKKIKIVVILGLGYLFDHDIYKYKEKYGVKVFKNVSNMPSLLQKSDIGITSNGRTLFEFAHFCTPCISLAQNDREKIHTFATRENGVIFLGEKHDFDNRDLLEKINLLLEDTKYRKKLSENMKNANKVLETSNQNICKLILNKYKYRNTNLLVQCRYNSSRLPGKATMEIIGKPMIYHVINRLKKCKNVNNVILCTSTNPENDIIEEIGLKNGINVFRGSEDNVLERFYMCAKKYNSKNVIRCTGDCPLIDPSLIDKLVENFEANNFYHLNFRNKDITRNNNFPDGFDAEIFKFSVLEEAYLNDKSDFGIEHVSPYIVKKYGQNYFKIPGVDIDFKNFHYSVDTIQDFNKISEIYEKLYHKNKNFSLYDVLKIKYN